MLGVITLLGAGYAALWSTQLACPKSTPTHGYACDLPAPDHPHLGLAVGLGLLALGLFVPSGLIAHFWRESIWWRPEQHPSS